MFKNWIKKCKRILRWIIEQTFPIFIVWLANKKIQETIDKLKEQDYRLEKSNISEYLEQTILFNEREKKRKEIIEDKAKSSLLAITISITIILNVFKSDFGIYSKYCIIMITVGILYFVFGAIASLNALNIKEFYDIYIDEILRKENDKIIPISLSQNEKIRRLYKYIKLNQEITRMRANYVYAAFICIRNGIIMLTIFFMLFVWLN